MTSTTVADQDAPSHDVIVVGGGPAGEPVAGLSSPAGTPATKPAPPSYRE